MQSIPVYTFLHPQKSLESHKKSQIRVWIGEKRIRTSWWRGIKLIKVQSLPFSPWRKRELKWQMTTFENQKNFPYLGISKNYKPFFTLDNFWLILLIALMVAYNARCSLFLYLARRGKRHIHEDMTCMWHAYLKPSLCYKRKQWRSNENTVFKN